MSDFLKKFKGIFVVEDSTAQATTVQAPTAAPTATPSSAPTAPPVANTNVYASSGARTNERFQEIMMQALAQNNQPGFDYFEYRESLKSLEKMPLDERTRYQSAYAMAQTMGATPDALRTSAQHYVSVLKGELTKFEEAHAQQRARMIGDREAEYENLDAVIKNKAEQIKQLTKEIEEANLRHDTIKTEIEQSTQKIELTKTEFEATYSVVVSKIQADVQKMAEYLK
jgi:chromosome segregation ATPase